MLFVDEWQESVRCDLLSNAVDADVWLLDAVGFLRTSIQSSKTSWLGCWAARATSQP